MRISNGARDFALNPPTVSTNCPPSDRIPDAARQRFRGTLWLSRGCGASCRSPCDFEVDEDDFLLLPNPRRHIDDILEARYFISEVPFEMRRRSGRRERSSDKWSQPRGGPRLCRSALFLSIDDLSELRAQVCKCEGLLQKCFAVPEDPHLNCAVRCKPRNIQDSEIRDGLH